MIDAATHKSLTAALAWYVDNGVTDIVLDTVVDRTIIEQPLHAPSVSFSAKRPSVGSEQSQPATFLGKSDAYDEAVKRAMGATTLDELRAVIMDFDGIASKKTASNIVFGDGHPNADIMVIGEVPGADDDRAGKPFAGESGQLLDKMLACIGLGRISEDLDKSVYMTNILNWRPPGNRTPNPAEIELSLPFIERHIQLVQPKLLIFCGVIPAKALLGKSGGISRLRKAWYEYRPQIKALDVAQSLPIQAIVTYNPQALLQMPAQKKLAWADMLMVIEKISKPS